MREPLYKTVYNALRQDIQDGICKPGDKLPPESELCKQYEASLITIRKALELLARDGMIDRHQGKQAVVAGCRVYRHPVSHRIGIITLNTPNQVFSKIADSAKTVLEEAGYLCVVRLISNRADSKRACLQEMMNLNVDGIIAEGISTTLPCPNADIYRMFEKRGIPIVFTNGSHAEVTSSLVQTDDRESACRMMDYLYSLGHRNIGGMFNYTQVQTLARYQGYLDGLKKYDLTYDDDRVLFLTKDFMQLFDEQFIYSRKHLMQCTAILCSNDKVVDFLETTLIRAGISVPGDISLAGFDGVLGKTAFHHTVTTMVYPAFAVGREAAFSLLKMLHSGQRVSVKTLPMKIRIGQTTAAPPSEKNLTLPHESNIL